MALKFKSIITTNDGRLTLNKEYEGDIVRMGVYGFYVRIKDNTNSWTMYNFMHFEKDSSHVQKKENFSGVYERQ